MDVGEAVGVAIILDAESECPFDHTNPTPPTVDNDLIGVGTTLGKKMNGAKSTYLYGPMLEGRVIEKVANPKNVAGHPFKGKAACVLIRDTDGTTNFEHQYPVTCAAHHLIPAQESLKESPLLAFMVKKGASESIKDGSYSDGVVWSDVGFDVNGSENGVYLPGSYAVGGGRGGMGVWESTSDGDEDDAEPGDSVPDPASNQLTGSAGNISKSNRKWQYVRQAVAMTPGQFHDRHVDYSAFVQSILEKMFEDYAAAVTASFGDAKCSKCKDKADKMGETGVPTPYGLVTRLNGVSARLKGFVGGHIWRMNIYTSKWGKNFMEAQIANNPDATIGPSPL